MAIPQSKKLYEPLSIGHFEALEQTCRLRQLSGSGDKYFFTASGVNQGHSTKFSMRASQLATRDRVVSDGTQRCAAQPPVQRDDVETYCSAIGSRTAAPLRAPRSLLERRPGEQTCVNAQYTQWRSCAKRVASMHDL